MTDGHLSTVTVIVSEKEAPKALSDDDSEISFDFKLGNVKLLSGKILSSVELAYKTYGKLKKSASNVIILPTFYTGSHIRNEGFIGKNRAINPNKY